MWKKTIALQEGHLLSIGGGSASRVTGGVGVTGFMEAARIFRLISGSLTFKTWVAESIFALL